MEHIHNGWNVRKYWRAPHWHWLAYKPNKHENPPQLPGFEPGSGHVVFVVDKVALGQFFSDYFGFPWQRFHRLLHTCNHLSSGAGTIGQIVADLPSGLTSRPIPRKITPWPESASELCPYHGKQTRKLTQLFKDTHMKIAFKTKNTIQNILKPYRQTNMKRTAYTKWSAWTAQWST
jgi:hypothetical protein